MTPSSVERSCEEAKQVLQEWVDKQGHNRCWYYPEIFRKLCSILSVVPSKDPALPPLGEFKNGCERYQAEEYGLSVLEQGTSNQQPNSQ